jgi:hypothetical protein
MNLEDVQIDNSVKLEDLHDNKWWIHGESKDNIRITIFLITIEGYQLKYTLEAINNLPTNIPFLVNVIMNVSPTVKAYNEMRVRCKTDYFVQLDEDMTLFPNSIETMTNTISAKSKNVFLFSYYLIDEYLGIGENKLLEGLKLYNFGIMKNYPSSSDLDTSVSSVDRLWHKPIEADGFTQKNIYGELIGYHAKYRKPFDLMIRYCKSTQSFINPDIKKNSGDICRFIKPYQSISNFTELFNSLVIQFLQYDYTKFCIQTFNRNYLKLLTHANKYVCNETLRSYDLTNTRVNLPDNYSVNINSIDLSTISIYKIFDIVSIIGIINVLFENYQYSFTKYPYDIYNYFMKIFNFTLAIDCANKQEIHNINKIFEKFDCVRITDDITEPLIDCILTLDDLHTFTFIANNETIQFKDEKEFIKYVLDRPRKNKYF